MQDEAQLEAHLAATKKAPRVKPVDLDNEIVSKHFFTAEQGAMSGMTLAGPAALPAGLSPEQTIPASLGLLTFCVLVLRNGFTVTGESACASPENFDAKVGQQIAYGNAREKLWPLLGFRLKDRLHVPHADDCPVGYGHRESTCNCGVDMPA